MSEEIIALSYNEISEAWNRFWSKNKLAIDSNGKVYRTNIPRKMPQKKFNFKKNESKLHLYKAHLN